MVMLFLERYAVPLCFSVCLHMVVVLAMLKQWSPDVPKSEIKRPNYVKAQLVKLEEVNKQDKKPKAKPQIVDLTKKRTEQERRKKLAEQKRQQKLKAQREAEKKRQAAERKKQEQEKKKKEAEERKKQEQIRQQREQQAFEQALLEEEQQLLEESYAVAAQSYMSAISQRIEQNWSRPPSARKDMECTLSITLVPTGRVVNVDVVKGSGNELFDRSAIQAVKKAEQFPEVKEMDIEVFERYYRELKLIFKPQDLRQ